MKQYEVEIAESNVIEAAPAVRMMMGHLYDAYPAGGSPDYDKSRYVYAQLDNLEYALERYMQGLASAYTTARAVMTFANRCLSPEFQERARHQVRAAAYSAVVIRVVGALCP